MNIISIFLAIALLLTVSARAQIFTVDSAKKTVDFSGNVNGASLHLPAVAKNPAYPGGKQAWQDFLRSNINIAVPFANKAVPGVYEVWIRFVVEDDGRITGIGADSYSGYGLEDEVIRCIKKSGNWIPAETSSGRKVAFSLRTLVIFTVKRNDVSIHFPN